MPSSPHAQEAQRVNGVLHEQAMPAERPPAQRARRELAATIDLLRTYQISAENDEELLTALLKAQKGEDELVATQSSLYNTIFRIRTTVWQTQSCETLTPPAQRRAPLPSPISQNQGDEARPSASRSEGKSPAPDNLGRQWLPSLSSVLRSLASPDKEVQDYEGVSDSRRGPPTSRSPGRSPQR